MLHGLVGHEDSIASYLPSFFALAEEVENALEEILLDVCKLLGPIASGNSFLSPVQKINAKTQVLSQILNKNKGLLTGSVLQSLDLSFLSGSS